MGWIGTHSQLMQTLRSYKCDQDEQGNFKVSGNIASFMGVGEEFVVDDEAVYFVDGQPRNLAAALSSTSYGTTVHVICAEDTP